MIDRATIEQIIDAAKVEEVVSDFVSLRRRGVNMIGLCPFHDEKTPSFTVSPAKNLWKCFGCGKGGSPVHFIMEHEQLGFFDALRWLAKKYHIEIKERELTDEEKQTQNMRDSMFVINEYAQAFFTETLHGTDEGKSIALSYLHRRGLNIETIKKFGLGYSPEKRDTFSSKALKEGYNAEIIAKTGVCYTTDDGRLVDRFWGRVIFPVHTISGKVVAFGGRIMQNNPKAAKYVNSPESEIYHKSDHLYGLYFAKQSIMQKNSCILVEGYLDVISMYQSGIRNVVASSGTSLTTGQIRLIHRFTNNVTLLYDGDKAGIKASLRGIDMLLEEGININVVLLPDGEDPDSYAQSHSTEEVEQYINSNKVDFIRFKTNLLLNEVGNDPIKRAGLIGDIVRSIAVVPNDILRNEYIKQCGEMLNVSEQVLVSETAKIRRTRAEEAYTRSTQSTQPAESSAENAQQPTPSQQEMAETGSDILYAKERAIIQFILKNGDKYLQVPADAVNNTPTFTETAMTHLRYSFEGDGITLTHPIYNRIFTEAAEHSEEEGFSIERYFSTHPDPDISRTTAELSGERYILSSFFAKNASDSDRNEMAILFEQTTRLAVAYKQSIIDMMLKETMAQLKDPAISADANRAMEVMQNFKFLKETQQALNNQLAQYGFGKSALNA